jgi:hypothetical protein
VENNISLKQFTKKVEALVHLLQERDAKIALLEAEKEELRKEIIELVVYVHFPVLKGKTNGFGYEFTTGVMAEVT